MLYKVKGYANYDRGGHRRILEIVLRRSIRVNKTKPRLFYYTFDYN